MIGCISYTVSLAFAESFVAYHIGGRLFVFSPYTPWKHDTFIFCYDHVSSYDIKRTYGSSSTDSEAHLRMIKVYGTH